MMQRTPAEYLEEKRIFDALFQDRLRQQAHPPTRRQVEDAIFWQRAWVAADASRAYRKRAAEWRDAGSEDWALQLEHTADAHDAAWDERVRQHRAAR